MSDSHEERLAQRLAALLVAEWHRRNAEETQASARERGGCDLGVSARVNLVALGLAFYVLGALVP